MTYTLCMQIIDIQFGFHLLSNNSIENTDPVMRLSSANVRLNGDVEHVGTGITATLISHILGITA